MSDCACICAVHRAFATVTCAGEARRTVILVGSYLHTARTVDMCNSCASWWEDSQSPTRIRRPASFSPTALFKAVMATAKVRGGLSYRQIAREAGLNSINTLTRIKQGSHLDADNLVRLLVWLGNTDLKPYLETR
jgi:hypothetical protein